MLGVICSDIEKRIVEEFFELFKIPWEFYRDDGDYDIILSSTNEPVNSSRALLLIYNSALIDVDLRRGISGNTLDKSSLEFQKNEIPVYGKKLGFEKPSIESDVTLLADYAYQTSCGNMKVIRIGYDLFKEAEFLMTTGQPPERAMLPSLELHIHLLRGLILSHGLPVIEIPPSPPGSSSITCLTHDVDFIRISDHKFDRTMFGFVYRALIGSVGRFLKGGLKLKKILANWAAVFSIPCVFLGICKDFFNNIDRYLEIEKNLASTFFIIPFKNRPGSAKANRGTVNRSVKYDISGIKTEVDKLVKADCEIGLHGIDAWADKDDGKTELLRIGEFSGRNPTGIRMHWLYFSQESPALLEKAGFLYDSSLGFNDAAGFKCGTAQVFRFSKTQNLSELPLIIQDTALFYPDRMGLDESQAEDVIKNIIQAIEQHGGVITFNWHQRSLGPERMWGEFYEAILDYLKSRDTLFLKAEETVRWFAKRRSTKFENIVTKGNTMNVKIQQPAGNQTPGLKLRVRKLPESRDKARIFEQDSSIFTDIDITNKLNIEIQL